MQKSNFGNIRLTFEELVKFMETCSDEDREYILKRIREEKDKWDNFHQEPNVINLN